MAETAEIKAKLVLDDAATKTVELVRGGFEKLGHSVGHVQKEIVGFVKSAASMALGFQFDRGIESLKEWGHEAMNAAKAAAEQTKEIAGLLAMQDQTGRGMDDLKKDAKEYREKLEEMGIQAGVSSAAIVDSFTDIAARSGKPTEEVMKMTEQMMYAGKIVPGGLSSITDGYRMMEMGMIRAKNPLVMLIAQSHLMQGSAKEVAKQLQTMAPEDAMKMADAAIGKMAEKGKTMPLKGGALIQSIKDMAEQSMVGAGEALMKALAKPYALVRDIFMQNRAGLAEAYKFIGEGLGDAITFGVEQAKKGIDYIRENSDSIKAGIKEAWSFAKGVMGFIVEHRKALMVGVGAMMLPSAMGAVGGVAGAIGGAASGFGTATSGVLAFGRMLGNTNVSVLTLTGSLDKVKKATTVAGEVFNGILFPAITKMGPEATAVAGKLGEVGKGLVGLGAAAAAVAGVALAFDQFNKLLNENRFLVQSLGSAIGSVFGRMKYQSVNDLENEAARREAQDKRIADMEKSNEDKRVRQLGTIGSMQYQLDPTGGRGTKTMIDAFNQAADAQDEGAEKYIASLILNSGLTVDYLKKAGFTLKGGLEEFQRVIGEGADPEKLKKFLGEYSDWRNKKIGGAPQVNFNNNKFEIHQDFRQEDPDRIALVFRRDILKAAEHRRQARTGGAFGP